MHASASGLKSALTDVIGNGDAMELDGGFVQFEVTSEDLDHRWKRLDGVDARSRIYGLGRQCVHA